MDYTYIDSPGQLDALCSAIRGAKTVGWDTEFIAEDVYRPDLCLVQLNVDSELFVIDPLRLPDLQPFWQAMVEGDHETVVHAGREELRFCWAAVGKAPRHWIDIQVAAGMVGHDFPAAYHKLINKVLGHELPKGETRTNWRHRPLTARQIEYALQDVLYLNELRDHLRAKLVDLGRTEWFEQESSARVRGALRDDEHERWRRISGISSVPERAMVIARELWRWRQSKAEEKNSPPKWILRDDLLVELARRGADDPHRIRMVRGMERRQLRPYLDELAAVIRRAKNLPKDQWPRRESTELPQQLSALAQFLNTAVSSICRAKELAPSLVGTVQDLRDVIAYRLKLLPANSEPPALAVGWRAEVIGHTVERLLSGELAIRIADPLSERPLVLEDVTPRSVPSD